LQTCRFIIQDEYGYLLLLLYSTIKRENKLEDTIHKKNGVDEKGWYVNESGDMGSYRNKKDWRVIIMKVLGKQFRSM
jgi:hypothetical protein